MFKRNIEVGRHKKVEGTRDIENINVRTIRISEEVNNREAERHVESMNLDIIMNCSRAYLIANIKNK